MDIKEKRERIREGVADIILNSFGKNEKTVDTAYDITAYLHSEGVVILSENQAREINIWELTKMAFVEPLIEE